ncbi:MAG: ATP-binding cassette domain-containing protein [Peptococcaceae bacterium]|nr:ATP-binding cassette domain-containing protein [Peptococcaceae bacterium]
MLKLEHISYGVEERSNILNDVSLEINDPFVAITGPNGSGKSTLMKVIAGIIKPDSGRIYFDGKDITDLSITERANMGISYAFQKPVSFKGLRVIDLLTLAAGKGTTLTEACEYLSEVGLCARDYINRELNDSLSGGEMKRIEIAMILARSTALSLFDEPEAGIDLWSFQSLISVFEKMNEKTNGNILIISHQERILNIAKTIIMMQDGKVVRQGTPEEVMPHILNTGCTKLMDKMA